MLHLWPWYGEHIELSSSLRLAIWCIALAMAFFFGAIVQSIGNITVASVLGFVACGWLLLGMFVTGIFAAAATRSNDGILVPPCWQCGAELEQCDETCWKCRARQEIVS